MEKFMLKLLIGLVIGYGLVCISVWLWQRAFIYHPGKLANPPPDAAGMPQFDALHIAANDGVKLQAWWAPPLGNKPVIVYFHGNAGNITNRAVTMGPYLTKGYGIFLLEYRGYAGNPGKPGEMQFYQDARTAMQFVKDKGIKTKCMVLYGESLGSGVATQMAVEYDAGALVLQSPFTSLADAGRAHYPFLPTRLLLREYYDNIAKIRQINMPLLVLHGDKDRIVPMKQGKALFDAAREPKQWQRYNSGGHGDLSTTFPISDDVIAFIERNVAC